MRSDVLGHCAVFMVLRITPACHQRDPGGSDVGFFSHFQGVIHLNTQVAYSRFQLGMT